MIKFSQFLIEFATPAETEKLSHLEHAEDHVINAGEAGFKHATRSLIGVHHALLGHKTQVKVTTKYDGAPSVIFGTHPENKKFFVASKSAFNKTPKINYTAADIKRNHGHAPGLVRKLTSALENLPKTTPSDHVYQGDLMYTRGDVRTGKKQYHFKPNTIKYSADKASPIGKKIKDAKLGVAIHTEYHGTSLGNMKASFGGDTSDFARHPDVHVIPTTTNVKKADYSPEMRRKFFSHIKRAKDASDGHDFSHLNEPAHQGHIKTYINQTVRDGSTPSVKGLQKHIIAKHEVLKAGVKRDVTKQKIEVKKQGQLNHISTHVKDVHNTLLIHRHLQNAKNVLVKALGSSEDFHHSIGGKKTGPEGHVALLGNKPTKLVDRSKGGFASANLLGSGVIKSKNPK
jgi:hypothetical protein